MIGQQDVSIQSLVNENRRQLCRILQIQQMLKPTDPYDGRQGK